VSIIEFSKDVSSQEAPEPLPVGDYVGEVIAVEAKTSAKGNLYLSMTFNIDPSDYPADYIEGDPSGTRLSYNRLLLTDTPPARYALRSFCEAVGARVPARQFDPSDLMGVRGMLTITHDEYEGQKRAQISKVSGV